jgi:outer membrane lipoprotein SlyB
MLEQLRALLSNHTKAEVWVRKDNGQKHITDLGDTDFEDGDKVVIMSEENYEAIQGALTQ